MGGLLNCPHQTVSSKLLKCFIFSRTQAFSAKNGFLAGQKIVGRGSGRELSATCSGGLAGSFRTADWSDNRAATTVGLLRNFLVKEGWAIAICDGRGVVKKQNAADSHKRCLNVSTSPAHDVFNAAVGGCEGLDG